MSERIDLRRRVGTHRFLNSSTVVKRGTLCAWRVVGRVCERVEEGSRWPVSSASRADAGRCEHRYRGRDDAAKAQKAAAISRMVALLLRGRFALVGTAIRAADPVDRVQGREHDKYHGCQDPSHDSIMPASEPHRAGTRQQPQRRLSQNEPGPERKTVSNLSDGGQHVHGCGIH